jgi:hypothetical protein
MSPEKQTPSFIGIHLFSMPMLYDGGEGGPTVSVKAYSNVTPSRIAAQVEKQSRAFMIRTSGSRDAAPAPVASPA